MKCVKPAFEKCPFHLLCDPGCNVGDDTDCAEYIASIIAQEEKKESENDGKSNDAC